MSGVWLPPNADDMVGVVHRPDPFATALTTNPALGRIVRAIVAVVEDSFRTHPMRGGSNRMTPEWERRRDFCVKTFRDLQGDLRWTTDRVLSAIGPELRAHLDNRPTTVTPRAEGRAMYAPDQFLASQGALQIEDVAFAPTGPEDGVESLAELKEKLKTGLDLDADGE